MTEEGAAVPGAMPTAGGTREARRGRIPRLHQTARRGSKGEGEIVGGAVLAVSLEPIRRERGGDLLHEADVHP